MASVQKMREFRRLSNQEKQQVYQDFASGMTDEEISRKMHRNIKAIQRQRTIWEAKKRTYGPDEDKLREELQEKAFWADIIEIYTNVERESFMKKWVSFYNELENQSSVNAIDEAMLCDVIRYDIMIGRKMREEKHIIIEKRRLEKDIELEREKPIDTRDLDRISNINQQITAYIQARTKLTADVNDLQQRKDSLLERLKATRKERVKQIEDRKSNFFKLVPELVTKEMRRRENRQNQLCKLCLEKETQKFSEPIMFGDAESDLPLFTAETVEINRKRHEVIDHSDK